MEFRNEIIGSFTNPNPTAEYVTVWFDETRVREFGFVSVGVTDVLGRYHRVHSVNVEARHVFAACAAFNTHPTFAIGPNSERYYVNHVFLEKGRSPSGNYLIEEIRLLNGRCVARLTRTGYIPTAA